MKLRVPQVLLVLVFLLFQAHAWGVTASFTASSIAGCSPLVVHFTNTSTGATSYLWDLGNGTPPVTSLGASGSYIATGVYTVTLTASNGSSSSKYTMTITVYPLPTVNFTASDTAICPGAPVTFTSTSVGGTPGPMTYTWNYGDGNGGTGATPTYAYNTPGYYNVKLSVTNSQGCTQSLVKDLYMHVYTPASIFFNGGHYCNPPATITLAATVTGFGPYSYVWTFGDGSLPSAAITPTHTYGAAGDYTVSLAVTDGHHCADSLSIPSDVTVGNIGALFLAPTSACVHSTVNFTNASVSYTSSSWTFGDGGTDTATNPSHAYRSPGTYTVTLIVSGSGCTSTYIRTITILPEPVASFTVTPANPCPAPATLGFNATVPLASTVTWKFGDGGTGSGSATTHTFASCGVDTNRMVVTDVHGCIDTITQVFDIYNLIVSINHDTIPSGCVPLTVRFHCYAITTVPDTANYPFGVATYTWNFGDGSPAITGGSTVFHTYTAVGSYTCLVSIITGNGCTATATLEVLVGKPPIADFVANPTTICAGQPVYFTNLSIGATSFEWLFGDGTISNLTNPIDTFNMPGIDTVTLIAFYNGCPDTFTRPGYITVDSPNAVMIVHFNCSPASVVDFYDSSLGANSLEWFFGDGDSTSLLNPVHNYAVLNTYTVMLTTHNNASGCRDTARLPISLIRPVPKFSASDTAVCKDAIVHFTPILGSDSISLFEWFRNGVLRDSTIRLYTDTFYHTGWYSIMFVIEDSHACFDTANKTNYVVVAKPVDSFTVTPASGCRPLSVVFDDQSVDVTGTTFSSFAWTFGDSSAAVASSRLYSHIYTATGTYSVREIVTDNIGCKDTINMPNLIYVDHPTALDTVNNLFPCVGYPDNFFNSSVGVVSALWLFGDGDSSNLFSTIHAYRHPGVYNVTLVVTDSLGCKDTLMKPAYLKVTQPVASFAMNDSFSICPPLSVSFTNASLGAVSYYWTFGDGDWSTDIDPGNLYLTVGYYPVTLVATNLYGCTDTAVEHVNIFGYAGAFTYAPLTGCSPLTVRFNANLTNVPNIIWDFDDGVTSPTSSVDSTTHTYAIPGAYVPKLILSDNTGCQNSSIGADTIKVDAVDAGFRTTMPVCLNDTFQMIDTSHSYWSLVISQEWYYGPDSSSADTPTYAYNATGVYNITLIVKDAWGCSAEVTTTVTVDPPPIIKVSTDTTVCRGDKATLLASGGITYQWSPPATLSCTTCNPVKASPAVPTTYTVTGRDKNGCPNTDTVTVFLRTTTNSFGIGDTQVCFGSSIQLFDSGGTKYQWIPGTGLSSDVSGNPIASPDATTTYMVVAQLADCSPDTNYIKVTVNELPTVHAGPDQTVTAGSTAQLTAYGSLINTLYWEQSPTLNCDSCYNPVASMSVTTTYAVNVISDKGCRNSDSVTIHVICASSQIWLPNAFTPNGDGQDDVFYPRGKGITVVKSFRIFNRWGNLLFERGEFQLNDAMFGWDGTFQGDMPHPDVYVYEVDAICETGEPVFVKGDVTIIR